MAEPRIMVNVRLSKSGLDAIDRLAEQSELTRSDMIRALLREALSARKHIRPSQTG